MRSPFSIPLVGTHEGEEGVVVVVLLVPSFWVRRRVVAGRGGGDVGTGIALVLVAAVMGCECAPALETGLLPELVAEFAMDGAAMLCNTGGPAGGPTFTAGGPACCSVGASADWSLALMASIVEMTSPAMRTAAAAIK